MGTCCNDDKGKPIQLVFDCLSYGRHEIITYDKLKLKKALDILSKRIKVPTSQIHEVQYNYSALNINTPIYQLNIPSGGVLLVKFKD